MPSADVAGPRRPRALIVWSTALVVLAAGLVGPDLASPSGSAAAGTPRPAITVSGGEVADLDGYRYHAFFNDPLDVFQGHAGGEGCGGIMSRCGGTNHGGGGGGGFGAPGGEGSEVVGGNGGRGFRADSLPVALVDALMDDGIAIGETSENFDGVWFAGGGGGGTYARSTGSGTPGTGGRGGGGDGAAGDREGISQGDHARPHTGGGGGGSGSSPTTAGGAAARDGAPEGKGVGGDGGSGVVILRWLKNDAPTLAPAGARVEEHGSHRYAIFLHAGDTGDRSTFTFSLAADLDIEYLVVGGGGGGGGETHDDYGSGGGGAGGVVSTLGRPVVLPAGDHVVEVGGGGRGGDGVAAAHKVGEAGLPGQPSRLGDVAHARGGGGGAARWLPAGSGASGGGGTSHGDGVSGRNGFPGAGMSGATSATFEVVDGSVDADVLVIAGGGSGGAGAGGGGGAGGVEWNFPTSGDPVDTDGARFAPLSLSGAYAITVGAGGHPVGAASSALTHTYSVGRDGSPSTFAALPEASAASITALGGGGGGRRPNIAATEADDGQDPDGRDGGSGGGAGRPAGSGGALGKSGEGDATLGKDGGPGLAGSTQRAGGGGGAGTAGGVSSRPSSNESTGGDGTPLFDAFLAPFDLGEGHEGARYVAAGGGGLTGLGGVGGGGDGTSAAAPTSAASGLPSTGSGGGALGAFTSPSGAGGSGVVIVRYPIPVFQQEEELGVIRIGDTLALSALVDPAADDVAPIELVDGTLPPGATLSSTAVSGTVTTAGSYTFTLRAFDRAGTDPGVAVDRTFTVEVFDALIVAEPFDSTPGDAWVLTGGGGWTPTVVNEDFGGETRGALRVTPAVGSRSGFALYDVPQQARAGLDVTFWASVWQPSNARGADGLVFFLKRGDDTSTIPGTLGARLGYGTGGSTHGISGALLGVGLDTFGGFMRHGDNGSSEGFTCPTGPNVDQPDGNSTGSPSNLTVRGPGQGTAGYCILAPHVDITPRWGRVNDDTGGGTRTREDGARRIRVRYDYLPGEGATSPSGQVRVWVDDTDDGDTPTIELDAPPELLDAETFKFGFSGATGGHFNNQEIWDVVVRSVTPLAPVAWVPGELAAARVGEQYGADLDAKAVGGVRPYTFTLAGGALPPGLSLNSPLAGTPTAPGTYTFDIAAISARGESSATETFTLVVEDGQVLELAVGEQSLASGTVTVAPVSRSATSGDPTGLPVTVASQTQAVCTVDGLEVTLLEIGTCTLVATQTGGTTGGITYTAAAVTASFEVSPAIPLTVDAIVLAPRVYDATTDVELADAVAGATLVGLVDGDDVVLTGPATGVADAPGVGTRTVTALLALAGADGAKYVLVAQPTLTVEILPRPVTVADARATPRAYDGTTTVTVSGARIANVVAGDAVTLANATSGVVVSRDVGTRAVTTSMTLSGADAANYVLVGQPSLSVTIAPRPASVTGLRALGRPWDGTTVAVLEGGTLQGVVPGERVGLAGVTFATFAAATPGSHAVTADVRLTGEDARNYRLSPVPPLRATISRATATLRITGGLTQFADGRPRAVRAGVSPADAGQVVVDYPGGGAPSEPGAYPIVVRLESATHDAIELRATLTIEPIDTLGLGADPATADPAVLEARRADVLARIAVRPDGTLALPEIGPVLEADGSAPALAPNEQRALADGEPAAARVVVTEGERVVLETDDGSLTHELRSTVDTPEGRVPVPVEADGTLVFTRGGLVEVGASGFLPDSTVEVWMFSEATFLGTVVVGSEGSLTVAFRIDEDLDPGGHTIQINGIGADGRVRSTSLGVRISGEPVAEHTGTGTGTADAPDAEDRVTVVTALADEPTGGRGPVALLLLAAALGALVTRWWLLGRRRRVEDAAPLPH